mmetsp:Transcript_52090/g.124036  ORF Transcript_52090/g.124036 Transcript_52090/m.124036 type:complete len:638 (-) Transcript_52090:47-1960(-)
MLIKLLARPHAFLVLCSLVLLANAEEEKEERASEMAVAMAGTLLGAITFMMSLFFMTNHPDEDMRRYTYEVISGTVSIFCAVLLFQSANDLVEANISEGLSLEKQAMIDMVHMLFWFTVLQCSLAWISGAVGETPKKKSDVELNLKCFAVVLAHMTGFASINAWGAVQQLPFFRASALRAFCVVPLSAIGILLLQRIADTIRYKVAMGDDGEEDEWEKLWDESCEECEDDVMGLMLSFNMTQATRFAISGILPDEEGSESLSSLKSHNRWEVMQLFGAGFLAISLMVLLYMAVKGKEEEKPEGDKLEKLEDAIEAKEEEEEEKSLSTELLERLHEATVVTLSMFFGWNIFYSFRWLLAGLPEIQDKMLLAVCLTMVISAVSFAAIRGLDILADQDWTDETVDAAIRKIIGAIALLVGFGWEQCFDAAVEAISSVAPYRQATKLFLAFFCVAIIGPAWKWWILPICQKEGYRFGFIIDHEDEDFENKWLPILLEVEQKAEKKKSQAQLVPNDDSRAMSARASVTTTVQKVMQKIGKRGPEGYEELPDGGSPRRRSRGSRRGSRARASSFNSTSSREAPQDQKQVHAALEKAMEALRQKSEEQKTKADGLRELNSQMDTLLSRMQTLEAKVLKPSASSA